MFHTSMGDSGISIFFTPTQTQLMQKALTIYESQPVPTAGSKEELALADVPPPVVKPKLIDPAVYPIFYLSTIVFRSPSDWSIWVSGHKITSQRNPTTLHVQAIAADHVTFTWSPSFIQALNARRQQHLFADTTTLKDKRITASDVGYDETNGVITFTLRPNQTFSPAYMGIFEGFVANPSLSVLEDTDKGADTNAATTNASAKATSVPSLPSPQKEVPLQQDTLFNKLSTNPESSREQTDRLLNQSKAP